MIREFDLTSYPRLEYEIQCHDGCHQKQVIQACAKKLSSQKYR